MSRTYAMEAAFGSPPKRFGVVVRELSTGRWVGPGGFPVVVTSTGVTVNAPHVFPAAPLPVPWGDESRVEITLDGRAPEGWYRWGLHELGEDGRPLPIGGRGVALARGQFYHSPDGSRDTEGRPTQVAPTRFVVEPAPRFHPVEERPS